jgi:putative flippase GtrA
MIVLVPAYQPDRRLIRLLDDLRVCAPQVHVVVVDDGSGPDYRAVFAAVDGPGRTLLTHPTNRGKGSALKTGFRHIARRWPGAAVVCADSDGQHSVADVLRVAEAVRQQKVAASGRRRDPAIVLGRRAFTGDVPARSTLGNRASAVAFRLATGVRVRDTQTGLRGYPGCLLGWLGSIRGERFEYELTVLLRAAAEGIPMVEVDIATIYLEENASSHFRPVRDSVRVLTPLLRFSAASLLSFAVDTVLLLGLRWWTGDLLVAVIVARLASAGTNFLLNRRLVFPDPHRSSRAALLRYAVLAAGLLAANYLLLRALTGIGVALLVAKIVTEVLLYAVSFQVQRRVVFRPAASPRSAPRPRRSRAAGRGTAG